MKKIIAILLSLFCIKCVYDRISWIEVLNRSDHTIYVHKSYEDSLYFHGNRVFTNDTLFVIDSLEFMSRIDWFGKDTLVYPSYRAAPDSLGRIGFTGWHRTIFSRSFDGKLRLFVFHEDTMRKYNWAEICKRQLYENKIVVTEEEMLKNNWRITYDP